MTWDKTKTWLYCLHIGEHRLREGKVPVCVCVIWAQFFIIWNGGKVIDKHRLVDFFQNYLFLVSNWDINILLWLGIQQWLREYWEHLVLTTAKQQMPGKNTLFERILVLKEAQEVAQNPSFENRRNRVQDQSASGQRPLQNNTLWAWALGQTSNEKKH